MQNKSFFANITKSDSTKADGPTRLYCTDIYQQFASQLKNPQNSFICTYIYLCLYLIGNSKEVVSDVNKLVAQAEQMEKYLANNQQVMTKCYEVGNIILYCINQQLSIANERMYVFD